jgi:hypothetical protein
MVRSELGNCPKLTISRQSENALPALGNKVFLKILAASGRVDGISSDFAIHAPCIGHIRGSYWFV